MNTKSTSENVTEWGKGLTGKAIAIATALVMVLSFGTLGAYGDGGGSENSATSVTTDDPTAVVVGIDASPDQAYVEVISQVIQGTGLKVPVNQDLTFEVSPVGDNEILGVFVNGQEYGTGAGVYTVPAADVRDSLTITVQAQSLAPTRAAEIINAQIVVDTMSYEYDGTEKEAFLTLLDEAGNVIEGYYAEDWAAAKFKDVTGGPVEATLGELHIFDSEGTEVTGQFNIVGVQNGSIEITPALIVITTDSADPRVYNGEPLTADGVTVDFNDGIEEFYDVWFTITATGSQTDVGESPNTYSIDWGGVNPANYQIEEHLGALKVTENEAKITIAAPSISRPYDGTPLVATQAVIANDTPFTVEATVEGSQTEVGEAESRVTSYKIIDEAGNDITDSFKDLKVSPGKLAVTPATLVVTTPSETKVYDGQPLTAKGENWLAGLAEGETVTINITGSQTEPGTSKNTYELVWDGTAKESNYTVQENLGTLEVLAVAPNAQPPSDPNMDFGDNGGTGAGGTGAGGAGANGTGATGTGAGAGGTGAGAGATPITGTPGVNYLSETPTTQGADGTATTGAVEAVAEGMQNVARGVVGEDPIPLTAPSTVELNGNRTPLGAFDAPVNNWLRWYVIVGILATALYGLGVLARRSNFTRNLQNQESTMLGETPEAEAVQTPAAEVIRG